MALGQVRVRRSELALADRDDALQPRDDILDVAREALEGDEGLVGRGPSQGVDVTRGHGEALFPEFDRLG